MGVADSVAALERGGMYAMHIISTAHAQLRLRAQHGEHELGVLKNRSSADPEVIEGGKDRGGERNGVTVMVSCLLLVSCPDPKAFWKNRAGVW